MIIYNAFLRKPPHYTLKMVALSLKKNQDKKMFKNIPFKVPFI